MNEEEKKAIVRAREYLTNPAGNYLSDEEIETILGLIDKQQRIMKSQEKIIMEQEKEIDKYKKQEFGNLFNGRYISKDKIRDKIKELKECRMRAISDIGLQIFNAEISMLEELLEEK